MTSTSFPDAATTWNQRFQCDNYIFGREPNDFLRSQAALFVPGSRALCVADGEGRNSVWLARQGLRVDAFDISETGVRKALALAADAKVHVEFSVSDCDLWPWPEDCYDTVVAIFVQFADPPMRDRLFAKMIRSLRPGGLLVLQGYTPKQLDFKTGGPPFLSHLYTDDMLEHAFASLHILELREYEADLAEGTQHHGRSALIGLVARK
jgi:SAM-dependent methyltransferase